MDKELTDAYEYQQKVGYTFNDSKEVTNTSFNNRFNFLLLAYALFINAYFMVETPKDKLTILIIGFLINLLLSIGIFRVHARYNILLDIVCGLDKRETTPIIIEKMKAKKIKLIYGSPPSITAGIIIPIIILLSFIAGILDNLLPLL
jgi:hypothetical protein